MTSRDKCWRCDSGDYAQQDLTSDEVYCLCTHCDASWTKPVGKMTGARPLTQREQQVVDGICRGQSNKEIGRRLGISEGTVKVHIKTIRRKRSARNRAQLAYMEGLAHVTPSVTPPATERPYPVVFTRIDD
jgi:DNA-binding NarL/FixJ family response regulator